MVPLRYASGDDVQLGDIVDVGEGQGPQMEVVVIIPSLEAVEGFDSAAWSYLKNGIVLRDTKIFGLLHLEELDHEQILVRRR